MHVTLEDLAEADAYAQWLSTPDGATTMRLLSDVVATFDAQARNPGSVTLVLTGHFTGAVQRRLDAGAEAYSNERLSGYAMGKTMPRPDGTIDVIVPAVLLFGVGDESADQQAFRAGQLRYLAEHEAQHVGMRQRGESTHNARQRLATGEAHGYFVASAGVAVEEHRAEFAAASRRPSAEPYWESVTDVLDSLRAALTDAVTLQYSGESMERPMRTAFEAVHNTWIALAYLAAHLRADGDITAVPPGLGTSPAWGRLVGPHWSDFAAILVATPPGSTPIDPRVIDSQVLSLAALMTAWFTTIGFGLRDIHGGMYFDVHTHDF